MAKKQRGLLDLSYVDAEAAYEYQRKLQQAETDALLLKYVGKKKYKQIQQKDAQFETQYQELMQGYQRPTHIQTRIDALQSKIMASAKPFMTDEYAMLGIAQGASKRDIRNTYRRKARKLHPDVGGDEEAFKQLHTAYRALLKNAQVE